MKILFYILRQILRFKGSTLTKIVSLTIGLTVGILIFAFNAFELSYDKFHEGGERMYRIGLKQIINGKVDEDCVICAPVARAMANEISEIEFGTTVSWQGNYEYQYGDDYFRAPTIYADTAFFRVFPYTVYSGTPFMDLALPGRLFVSEKFANKVFGDVDPVGQELLTEDGAWIIAGVFQDTPENTHLKFQIVRSLKTLEKNMTLSWVNNDSFCGYLRLRQGVDNATVEAKMSEVAKEHLGADYLGETYYLQSLPSIIMENKGAELILLYALAFIIIIVSALNYILLSMSSLAMKAKEAGIRKVNGATAWNVFYMFLIETIVFIVISVLISVGIILLARYNLESMMYISSLRSLLIKPVIWMVIGVILLMIILAGIVPARLLASVSVMQVFRPATQERCRWKKGLLWGQFTAAGFTISLLIIFALQYNLIVHYEPGYDMKGLYFSDVQSVGKHIAIKRVKEELKRLPFVENVSLATNVPLYLGYGNCVYGANDMRELVCTRYIGVDCDFLDVLSTPIISGIPLQEALLGSDGVVVNRRFMELLRKTGYDQKTFLFAGRPVSLKGEFSDFQIGSLYNEQRPLLLCKLDDYEHSGSLSLLIRMNKASAGELKMVESKVRELTGQPRVRLVSFLEVHEQYYNFERIMRDTVMVVSILALLVTILGVMGFAGDEVTRRTKEIAIRKVNGASVCTVILLLFRKICWLVLLSLPFALGAAYYVGDLWLQRFAVRTSLTWWIFVSAVLALIVMVSVTIIGKSYKGITANPAEILKSE